MKRTGFVLAACVGAMAAFAAERGWVIENEDNDHYFYGQDDAIKGLDAASKEALEKYADHLLEGGRVTHVFWCVNGQRPNYDSKVWEPIWTALSDPLVKQGHSSPDWPKNAKKMFDSGIDPYKVWIDRTRAKGASAWVSMRMNDNHDVWVPHATRVTRFSQDNPRYWIIPNFKGGQWEPYALDFVHPEVRDWTFALAKEIIERYDADGIELDFLRASSYFKADEAVANQPIMTAFIKRCREVANAVGQKRGRPYQVAMRMPATIEEANADGFDVAEILRQGLVDVVIACNQSDAHWDVPVKAWKKLIAANAPQVRLVAGTTAWSHSPASLRGWTAKMREEGAENFYVFNLQWANPALQKAVRPDGAFDAAGCRALPQRFTVDQYDPPAPPPRHMVKADLVKAAFKADGWRYAVDGETPRAFEFSKRRNLRVKAKADGTDYPVLGKAKLTGELVAEADGFVALGMGFDWRWELDVNGVRTFGRNELVDAQDACKFRASDWTVRVPVKKGVNTIAVSVDLGTVGEGEMRVVDASELKDGIDVLPQEEYAERTKSGIAKPPRETKFNAPITRALAYKRALPKAVKASKGAVVEMKLTHGQEAPTAVRLNGVASDAVTVKGGERHRTLRAAFPAGAVRPGDNVISTDPFMGKSGVRVLSAALEIE